jgi:predicted NBD/HSP70 family sugar kinase
MPISSDVNGRKPEHLRVENRRAMLALFRDGAVLTALEVAERIHLSRTLVTRTLQDFEGEGLLTVVGKGSSTGGGGKRPNLFQLNAGLGCVFAVEIQSDRLYTALADMSGRILHTAVSPIDSSWTGDAVIAQVGSECKALLRRGGLALETLRAIVVGTHGVTDGGKGQVRISPHFPKWDPKLNIRKKLEALLGVKVPIHVDNLIRFMAYGEIAEHPASSERIALIWARDGVVAGLINGTTIEHGQHFLSGEIGHMILDPGSTEPSSCGCQGCFECKVLPERILKRTKFASMAALLQAAAAGKPAALAVFDDLARWFSLAINNLSLIFDPQRVIIHAPYCSPEHPWLISRIKAELAKFPLLRQTQLEISPGAPSHEDSSLHGAIRYAIDQCFQSLP